jgi:2-phosphosulfolactate phosphatase
MRLDVFFSPAELSAGEINGRTVVVIDVLRAGTTIVEALAAGARAIYPAASTEEAIRIATNLGRSEVVLCGERKCLPIEGFDLGHSPREFTPERVSGKTLVMTTTNGTQALALAAGAAKVYIASLTNLSAVVEELARTGAEPVLVCSGREKHFALEDAVCAGEIAARLMRTTDAEWQLNDGARAALTLASDFPPSEAMLRGTAAAAGLEAAGLADDIALCAEIDRSELLPVLQDRQITLAAAAAEPR